MAEEMYPPVSGGAYPTGIYAPMQPFFRDQLDARRSMFRRTPDSEYPDGYLDSTITSRRGDRILSSLKVQINKRSYDRGVHKGERIDQRDYFWPDDFNPMSGLRAQALGVRQAPLGPSVEIQLINDGKGPLLGERDRPSVPLDTLRARQLRYLRPKWE